MPPTEESTLLNRILKEIRGLRSDIKAVETEQGNVRERLTKLEEDRATRDRAAQSRTAYVCAFGALVLTAIFGLFSMVYDTRNKVEAMNNYGTAYGRGKEDVFTRRFEELEKKRSAP